ncbi:MAG: hypothetical protein U0797_02960 [Gemmataceae bacterium]
MPRDEDDDEDYAPSKRVKKKGGSASAVALKPVKATEYGVIRGKVAWEGPEPSFAEETAKLRAAMSGSQDKDYCLTGKTPDGKGAGLEPCEAEQQTFRIGKNKQLGNVFVWIQPEPGHYFEIPKEQLEAVPKTITLTQPHCSFLPHCLVLFPSYRGPDGKLVPTGQKFFIENDARVGHNANVKGGPLNTGQGSSIEGMKGDGPAKKIDIVLKPDSTPVTIACNIHGWMMAWARVYDHPYATLSSVGADPKAKRWENLDSPEVGTYEIKGVPVGAKVKLFAWHEVRGPLGEAKGKEIVLKKENVEDFTAK